MTSYLSLSVNGIAICFDALESVKNFNLPILGPSLLLL